MNARTWFDRPERIAKLHFHAQLWIGTPFCGNSETRGARGGVSCQKLVSALYREAGFADIRVPEVAMAHARFSRQSLVEAWMANRRDFLRIDEPLQEGIVPGDLLGFRLGTIVHHLGILLTGQIFVHACDHVGTDYSSLADGTWSERLAVAWRPVLEEAR